jgi:hypothetical protein
VAASPPQSPRSDWLLPPLLPPDLVVWPNSPFSFG